ncbi:MAG: orotate phosphoribosyltransferase [Bdellovibrionota bacterium]|nr:orotate phosphoribosyltransferase [Bdellovibrionota bacterium]
MNAKEIAKILVDIEAVRLSFDKPFKWVSGIESPIYCDNRLIISDVEGRKKIAKAFAEKIKLQFPETELIAGTATAGIPHAAWVAEELNLPMLYVRSKAKEHGTKSLIEGKFKSGQKCILIEDLISTGKSSLAALIALKEEGLEVNKVYSIFSYGLKKAEDKFRESSFEFESLSEVDALIEYGLESGFLSESNTKQLRSFFASL